MPTHALYADLLFTGGPVYTADPAGPHWAEAVAVRDGRLLAVGSAAELADLRGPQTEVVDLAGRMLLPGFTESHVHFIELALRAVQVDATDAASAHEVAGMVDAALAQRRHDAGGGWVRGGGWNVNIWADGSLPHRRILDAAAPDTPVALDSKAMHAVWVNSAALRRAGITAMTPDVPGGVIERDADGEPTGVLHENAADLVARIYPKPEVSDTTAAVLAATPGMWQTGIVALHNANDSCDGLSFRTYQALRNEGWLGLRVVQHIPVCNLNHATALGLRSGLGDAWLRIGGIKMFADGALGNRTASMLQPFTGEPDNWGVPTTDPEEMLELALAASAAGLSLTIHAIGDRANRDVLNVLAEVRRQETPGGHAPRLRHRIEHVQVIHPADLPRLAALDVLASVQPIHATSDMLIVDRFWGPERAPGAYAFRSLLDSGAHLVFGSDGPIEPHAPLTGIHAAVTRRRANGTPGPDGWQPQERITVAEAVDAYTYWPAYAAGEESYRGSITPGKVADLVVLGANIFEADPMTIRDTPVAMTVLDGKVVWRAGN
jgi:predicted amidohydrolase YtcJ